MLKSSIWPWVIGIEKWRTRRYDEVDDGRGFGGPRVLKIEGRQEPRMVRKRELGAMKKNLGAMKKECLKARQKEI